MGDSFLLWDFRHKALRAIRITASLIKGRLRIGVKRTGEGEVSTFLFRDDHPVRRFAVLDPIDNDGKPIDFGSARTTAAMETTRDHE